jgi:hypothetical protein
MVEVEVVGSKTDGCEYNLPIKKGGEAEKVPFELELIGNYTSQSLPPPSATMED